MNNKKILAANKIYNAEDFVEILSKYNEYEIMDEGKLLRPYMDIEPVPGKFDKRLISIMNILQNQGKLNNG